MILLLSQIKIFNNSWFISVTLGFLNLVDETLETHQNLDRNKTFGLLKTLTKQV